MAVIAIRDHGSGVPAEALQKIFQPFYRVDDSRNRKTGGTGIGLAIAERVVRFHKGSITASHADDHGLVVEMKLPI